MKNLIVFACLLCSITSFAQKNTNERAQWFTDSRFGMFIHWGVYSAAEGYWKGEKLRHDNDYAEWILYRNRIDRDEYVTLLDRFQWDEIDPEEWVILAKKSGMKYITITAKHHVGFGLWDSKVSDYDLGDYTNPKRDIIAEMAEACKKHGIKLCLYYSHWVDWEHPLGWDHSREIYKLSASDYDRYWQQKVIPQITELLTNYGEISMLWFDMWIHHSESIVSKEQLLQLKSLIRDLQPNCLVNSRLGLSIDEDPDIDYKTLGDNQLGDKKEDFPWQSPATVAHSWGFHSSDSQWKSTTTLLKSLIGNVSLNGNFMLNIGPRANGDVPYEISQRMLEMGKWLQANGESIYGAEAFDLDKDLHDWGKITCKQDESSFKLFLHVYNWPLNKQLNLTGISATPEKIYLLTDEQKSPHSYSHSGAFTQIALPADQPDPYVSVVIVEYPSKPEITDGLVAKTSDDGYSLLPGNQNPQPQPIKITPPAKYGTIPAFVAADGVTDFSWKIYVDQPGTKRVDVSYSFQGNRNNSQIVLKASGQSLYHSVHPTGQTVGEPNQDWHIDNFESNEIGTIDFPQPGFYTIELSIQPTEADPIKFQWLWIQ